jgi:nitroreductase
MTLRDLVLKNRTIRRFYEEKEISGEDLVDFVDLARQTASGGNQQPLRYRISCDRESNEKIFPHLKWAAYLDDGANDLVGGHGTPSRRLHHL